MNRDVWIEAGRLSDEGHGFCLAVIETSRGSVPRRAGSVMLVRSDGTTIGTVGGGDFERMAAKEALEVLAENKPRIVEYDLHDPQGEEIQAVCGGHLTILMLPQAGRMALHLFGAGHVARPVCKLAAMTGYTVIVYDETDNWATRENFPDATTFRTGSLADAAANLEWNPQDAVVILTGAHTIDFEILRQCGNRRRTSTGAPRRSGSATSATAASAIWKTRWRRCRWA